MDETPKQHIFISYSRADKAFIDRLILDLQEAGLVVWLDTHDLKPGTHNWEEALRSALAAAYAVLLIASPTSRRSPFVQDEIAIANMMDCPIYPIWAAGEEWIDCIPMGMGKMQYIDARDHRYEPALPVIVESIQKERDDTSADTTTSIAIPTPGYVPPNPYKGLEAFTEEDADRFFGRDIFVGQLVDVLDEQLRANTHRLMAIVGASGSGKSSVVMAGLLPRLRDGALPKSENWTYLPRMLPGARPMENLANTLYGAMPNKTIAAIEEDLWNPSAMGLHRLASQVAKLGSRAVLYIDQFEEIFTQTVDEEERKQFIDLIVQAATEPDGVLIVILTLRADFYDRPLNYEGLGRLLKQPQPVLPMSLADLYDAIQKPADKVSLKFEDNLVASLVFDVRDQLGGLPLLQFTLDRLYEMRDGRKLTMASYRQLGGVRGALAEHAENTYNKLPSDQHKRFARSLFLRLIEPGATEQDTTRRRAALSELVLPDPEESAILREVADRFIRARLLVTNKVAGEDTIEVGHEALIREWGTLGAWLHDAREDVRFQKNIAADSSEWIRRGRPVDMLYRGTVLDDAQRWAKNNAASVDELEYIKAALAEQERQQLQDAKIARRVQNFQRASIVLGVFVGIAVIAALLLSIQVGTAQSQIADANNFVATAGQQVAVVGATLTQAGQAVNEANQQISEAQVQQEQAVNNQSTAEAAATQANADAADARAQVAEAQAQIAGVQPTLDAAGTQIGGVAPTLANAQTQVAGAGTEVAQSGLTLTPIPSTLTPVALTLAAGDAQLAEARQEIVDANQQIASANEQAASAQTQVYESGLTLTPIPSTLTPVALTLAAGDEQLAAANQQIVSANEQAFSAQTRVAEAGLTLAPIPDTLTPVAITLAAGATQAAEAQKQIDKANQQADAAETAAAQSALTLTPVPLTLTPVGATLAAAQAQVAGVQPTLDSAQTQIADVQPALNAAKTQVAGVEPTLSAADTQVAGVQPTLAGAQTQIAGVLPTLDYVQQQVQQQSDLADSFRLSVAAQNLLQVGDPDLAISLMLQAYQLNTSVVETQRVLNAAIPLTVRLNLTGAIAPANLFSPDGRFFVTTDNGSNIIIWDVAGRRQAQVFQGNQRINYLLFSPNGRYLASGDSRGGIAIWDMEAGTPLFQLSGHRQGILSLAFSPDGTRLISGSADYTAILWNLETGQQIAHFTDHEAPVSFVNFNANGTKAFSYDFGRQTVTRKFIPRITVYDMVTNTDFIQTPTTYRGLSPNGQFAYTGGDGSDFFTLWNPSQLVKNRIFRLGNANEDYIDHIAFSEDNRQLLVYVETRAYGANQAYVVRDRHIAIWDIATGAELRRFQVSEENPQNWDVTSLAMSKDGHLALTGGRYGSIYTVTLWDVDTGEELRRFTGHNAAIERVGFSDDNRYAYSYSNGSTRVWDITTELYQSRQIPLSVDSFAQYGLSADGSTLYIAYNGNSISTWNLATGKEDPETRFFTGSQNTVAFSPTQPYALVSAADGTVLWNIQTKQRMYRLDGVDNVRAIDFSSDGHFAALSTGNGVVIWDVDNGVRSQTWNLRNASAVNLFFNQYVLAGSSDQNNVQLYDAVEHSVKLTFGGFTGKVNAVAFNADGTKVAAAIGEPDNAVIIWDVATGNQDYKMVGHSANVNSVAFSPDGQTLISGSDDMTIILWDAKTGQSVTRFTGHSASVISLLWSTDGHTAYSSSTQPKDGILAWQIRSVQDTVNWVYDNRYVLQLDCNQRLQYNVRPRCDNGVLPTLTPTFTPQATFTPTATSTLRPTFTPTATSIPTGRLIGTAKIRLRTGPSTNFKIVTQADPGITVQIIEETPDHGWVHIRLADGTDGWISANFIDR